MKLIEVNKLVEEVKKQAVESEKIMKGGRKRR